MLSDNPTVDELMGATVQDLDALAEYLVNRDGILANWIDVFSNRSPEHSERRFLALCIVERMRPFAADVAPPPIAVLNFRGRGKPMAYDPTP